ncbi:MAG: bacterio-opsin activator [Calditrichaeota bacterium]|nr:bacterio-opsin activator [Calditrichota bacterium]
MVMEVKPREQVDEKVDQMALRIFLKALELLGGPRKLVEYRNLTWLPSLMEAAYTVVLFNDYMKTEAEIAEMLGLTRNTVAQILRAVPEIVKEKLEGTIKDSVKTHTAGALAKIAYQEIKEGRENIDFLTYFSQKTLEAVGYTWPIEVLVRLKGVDFPANREVLLEKLSDLSVEGRPLPELLRQMDATVFPVQSPSQLLHHIKEMLAGSR